MKLNSERKEIIKKLKGYYKIDRKKLNGQPKVILFFGWLFVAIAIPTAIIEAIFVFTSIKIFLYIFLILLLSSIIIAVINIFLNKINAESYRTDLIKSREMRLERLSEEAIKYNVTKEELALYLKYKYKPVIANFLIWVIPYLFVFVSVFAFPETSELVDSSEEIYIVIAKISLLAFNFLLTWGSKKVCDYIQDFLDIDYYLINPFDDVFERIDNSIANEEKTKMTENKKEESNNTEKNQNTNKINKSIANDKKNVFRVVLIISIIFLAFMIIFNIAIFALCATGNIAENTANNAYQNSLLTIGLAIIGIAIAVWAGLNVVSSIERRDFEEKSAKINDLSGKVDMLDEQVESMNSTSLVLNYQLESLNKTLEYLFTSEIHKSSRDFISMYFFDEFIDFFIELKNEVGREEELEKIRKLLPDMIMCEQVFSQVYTSHNGFKTEYDQDSSIMDIIDKGIKIINKIKKDMDNMEIECLLLDKYLVDRLGDFYFYRGYRTAKVSERYGLFFQSAIEYEKLLDLFAIRKFNPDANNQYVEFEETDNKNRRLYMYLINSIGEAYSCCVKDFKKSFCYRDETVDNEQIINKAKKAVKYLDECVQYIDPDEAYEVYHRNRGCAYERLDKVSNKTFEHREEIVSSYKKALKMTANTDDILSYRLFNVYYVNIQYLFKYLNSLFDKYFEKGIPKLTKEEIEKISQMFKDNIEDILYFQNVLKMAKTQFPTKKIAYNVEGTWLLYVYCFMKQGIDVSMFYLDNIERCYAQITEDIIIAKKFHFIPKNKKKVDEYHVNFVRLYDKLQGMDSIEEIEQIVETEMITEPDETN